MCAKGLRAQAELVALARARRLLAESLGAPSNISGTQVHK